MLPASAQDVASTIEWAARGRRPIAPQGQSHSVFGRSQAQDGIVIDMSPLQTVHRVEPDRVVVDAGATWSQVLAATLPRGLTPPVLTDHLNLSVGGTLVVGGVGAMTPRFGVQADTVLEMDVITGTGERVTCSPGRHRDLFDTVRAGLGQVGVIARATIALIASPVSFRRFLLFYADLRTMLNDARLLARDDHFDAVQGAVLPTPAGWPFRLDAVKAFSTDPAEARRLVAANRAIYERIRADGGTLYPVSAFPMSRRDWRQHFGPAFHELETPSDATVLRTS